jgi:hypothetical protein
MESHITDITRVIQLAVAPVFLLTAIGTLIAVLNLRLGRNIDRRRLMEEELRGSTEDKQTDEQRARQRELRLLARRVRLIYFAMLSAGLGALLVCLVVAGAFVGALVAVDISRAVAVLFILAMFAVIGCLGLFLREADSRYNGPTQDSLACLLDFRGLRGSGIRGLIEAQRKRVDTGGNRRDLGAEIGESGRVHAKLDLVAHIA